MYSESYYTLSKHIICSKKVSGLLINEEIHNFIKGTFPRLILNVNGTNKVYYIK